MAGLASPVRRVLTDKNKNASLQINKHGKPTSTTQATPAKSAVSSSSMPRRSEHANERVSPKLGQKRKIDEVQYAENGNSQNSTTTQPLSDLSNPLSHADTGDMNMDSINETGSTAPTALLSFHASQADIGLAETQFEIHEEMSQKTLDRLHAVSLPPNNSLSFLRPSLLKDNSQISVSMSSLIDFDQDGSQGNDNGQEIKGGASNQKEMQEPEQTDEAIREATLVSKAATLRTRLQLAFYKVQTNQASTPFSRLGQPLKSASPPPHPYSSSPMSSPHTPIRSRYVNSPESRIAIARARAAMQKKPSVKPLGQIAMPDMRPTAFSARWLQQDEKEKEEMQIPSSPPDSQGAGISASRLNWAPRPLRVSTPSPTTNRNRPPHTPMQLGSPPGSPPRSPTLGLTTGAKKVRGREAKHGYGGLTSSVVKGEAANSLLQLNRAVGGLDEVRGTGRGRL